MSRRWPLWFILAAIALCTSLRLDIAYYGWQVGVRVSRVEVMVRCHGRSSPQLICFLDGQAL